MGMQGIMDYPNLKAFISSEGAQLCKGPVALLFIEDDVEVESTLDHHINLGFKKVVVFAKSLPEIDEDTLTEVTTVDHNTFDDVVVERTVNILMPHLAGAWVYVGYNAEYLFFPFSSTRSISELVAFHTEERRGPMLTYVVDLYARDLTTDPTGVNVDDACLDRAGYYALARLDARTHQPLERQLNFYGGLKWRYEEFIPYERRRIDCMALFRAKSDLEMKDQFLFSDPEYNTYSCPWHNNITAAVASFRTAKALKRNPSSSKQIENFHWFNSVRFSWTDQQFIDLGLIEPGQWF